MNKLHAAHLGPLFLGMALASPTAFAGDETDRYSDKGGAVTHAQWAHGTAEKNFGVIRQVRLAENLGIIGGAAPPSEPATAEGTSTGEEQGK